MLINAEEREKNSKVFGKKRQVNETNNQWTSSFTTNKTAKLTSKTFPDEIIERQKKKARKEPNDNNYTTAVNVTEGRSDLTKCFPAVGSDYNLPFNGN